MEIQKPRSLLLRDITEQKKAEKKIADSEKLYRMLFELSPTGVLLEDMDGIILDVNPAFLYLYGLYETRTDWSTCRYSCSSGGSWKGYREYWKIKKGRYLKTSGKKSSKRWINLLYGFE